MDLHIKQNRAIDNLKPSILQYICKLCEQNTLEDHLFKVHYKDYETENILVAIMSENSNSLQLNEESVMEIEQKILLQTNVGIKQTNMANEEIVTRNQDLRNNMNFTNINSTNTRDIAEAYD